MPYPEPGGHRQRAARAVTAIRLAADPAPPADTAGIPPLPRRVQLSPPYIPHIFINETVSPAIVPGGTGIPFAYSRGSGRRKHRTATVCRSPAEREEPESCTYARL